MKQAKREVELVVISDVHLGTYGSRAGELVDYLQTISPKTLVLNGDIIDIWQFKKSYFPTNHMHVIKTITSLLTAGTKVYYITGNHDEMLRKFKGLTIGNFQIVNKIVLELDGQKAWIFHGDVFDTTMKYSKWLAKLGGKGYDLLILLNTCMNWCSVKMGRGRISLSKKVKDSVKGVIKYVNNFEETAAEIAIESGYDFVVCGHIHQPAIRTVSLGEKGSVTYLNSGDWIENMTALEYHQKEWKLYKHTEQSQNQRVTKIRSLRAKKNLDYDVLLQEVMQTISH